MTVDKNPEADQGAEAALDGLGGVRAKFALIPGEERVNKLLALLSDVFFGIADSMRPGEVEIPDEEMGEV